MTVEYKPASPEIGVVSLASPYTVEDTTERVVRVIERAGMTIFACIDQQGAAQAVGLTMRPMMLVLFGNPKGGTPLMQAYPTLAIDLPLKALVWEDADGRMWVSTNSPEYMQRRHGLAETPFAGVPGLLAQALESSKTGA
jgi:uncharacterized protein (DUF302 family)